MLLKQWWKKRLIGKNVFETLERLSILVLVIGCALLGAGILATVITPRGLPVIVAMGGGLLIFVGTASLILSTLMGELSKEAPSLLLFFAVLFFVASGVNSLVCWCFNPITLALILFGIVFLASWLAKRRKA